LKSTGFLIIGYSKEQTLQRMSFVFKFCYILVLRKVENI
ncbi:unnamed protein product, partial [Gulo gulo]